MAIPAHEPLPATDGLLELRKKAQHGSTEKDCDLGRQGKTRTGFPLPEAKNGGNANANENAESPNNANEIAGKQNTTDYDIKNEFWKEFEKEPL